jgi:translation initiation factor 4G
MQQQQQQQQQLQQAPLIGPDGQPLGPVKPLEKSDNAWAPMAKTRAAADDQDSPAMVDRKVKALLNKLTMEKFDSISDQIISWANKSETQTDGRTLIQVIRLVFEKATDEAAWSEMYARLCRKMMEQISPKVQDEGIKNPEGKPIAGGQLFRKYLLNRCQEDFERGWAQKDAAAAAAAAKATDDEAAAAANSKEDGDEVALYSEEYYALQKAKRQGLGLVKFIGELFKLQMLTERIMHECVKKLLNNVENPEEEEIESLCKLLTTVGKLLETPRGGPYLDIYFSRMRDLQNNPKVSSRMQFMLMEVIELRDRKWVPRNQSAAPATIAQIREDAAKETQQREREAKTLSMSRTGSRRGGDRSDAPQVGPDGWTTAGPTSRAPPKAGDLSKFGQIGKPAPGPLTFGPTSVFAKKEGSKRDSGSLSRTTSMNAFSLLSQNPDAADAAQQPQSASGKGSRPASRKPSVDFGPGGAPEVASGAPQQRRKLQLLPRSKPIEDATSTPGPSEPGSPAADEDEEQEEQEMSEAEAVKKIAEDIKEFFAVRNIDEAEDYFVKLPSAHRFRLVDKLVTRAIESKVADAELVGDLFARAVDKSLCTPDAFEQGFMPVAEMLDDIAIDAPKAFDLMAIMMKGAGLDKDDERRARIAEKSMDGDKLLALLA